MATIIEKEQRLSKGLCSRCGYRQHDEGRNTCQHCRDKANSYRKEYYKTEKGGSYQRLKSRKQNEQLKVDAFAHYGGKCVDCGETDFVVIEFHHVDGNGKDWRGGRNSKSGHTVHLFRKDGYPEDIVPLCANCHKRRHYTPPSRAV
jgi:predicted HNH restriction endonuclease